MQTPLGEKMAIHFGLKSFPSLFLVYFVVSAQKVGQAYRRHAFSGNLSACSKAKEGNHTLYRKVSGDGGVAICLKNNGQYQWKFMDGTSTLGERFDPAKDCSDIVDNLPDAKDGFFWIKRAEGQVSKGYCDTHTDDGGYLLIGMKDSPVTWNVSTNQSPVHPTRYPHWSSNFGDVKVQDFAIQISTTKNFEDTKAHWSYRLKESRPLGNLFGIGSGGCTDFHSGIGNVSYVKDILTDTVVTKRFNCSKFGTDVIFGWQRMNYCLRNQCPNGYAYIKELVNFKLDSHGSFSYSASSEFSGITHHSTAFVGCDSHKCCACFGPKGGRGHYCGRKCEVINEGTLLTGQVYVWYWIRTRMPKRLWKRCMEFKKKTPAGKYETYHIDRITNTARKGKCSGHFGTFLNEGTLLVNDRESLKNLPAIPGLISFRKDNKKLYVNKENEWSEIGDAKVTENLTAQVRDLQKKFENKNFLQEIKTKKLEARLRTLDAKLKKIENETETFFGD
ncbi:uncharacterized protein LOC114517187 [Dendronephthya gigantea]|uniref:uncharacterized protein LOC114517187 n=1 Tax=Dendronephthya gigantea TaxID=151771 RepID=UPI00106B3150|nr:uncharacterized protein LOC114517187 [Dendronephthya gigantea]